MPAFALQSADDLYRLIPREPEHSKAQSPEAHQISERTSDVLSHVFNTNTYETAEIDAVRHLLVRRTIYWVMSFLMCLMGMLLVLVYTKSGVTMIPILAFNIGASAPFILGNVTKHDMSKEIS